MAEGALSDIKVLDLTHYIAGPYCTKLLADLGAVVIKVERPGSGDEARRLGPFPGDIPHPEKSGAFLYCNTSKKGITLNLKSEAGQAILKELVKDTDVLVENFHPRVMPGLGLSYEVLEKINPRLVMTSISNFGQTGPYRDYKAVEINLAALGGPMYQAGNPEREPLKEPGSTFQFAAGSDACGATLAALFAQKTRGFGQHVDLSVLETVVSCLSHHVITWGRTGLKPKRRGPYTQAQAWPGAAANSGVYPCKDGYVLVTIRSQEELVLTAALTGKEEFANSDIICVGFGKTTQPEEINRLLLDNLKNREKEEVFHSSQDIRLFWTSVKDIKDVFDWEQYRARDFWVELDHPHAGKLTYPGTPYKMSETPVKVGRAPLLGEHNEEIYCQQLGYSPKDLVKLREAAVI